MLHIIVTKITDEERKEVREMWLLLLVWIVGISCIAIMKKIEPEIYKVYTLYVLAIELIFTVSLIQYL